MILVTHAVVGAAITHASRGKLFVGLGIAFMSHFALDAIPHWHYRLRSFRHDPINPMNDDMVWGTAMRLDLFRIGVDFSLGLGISFLIFGVRTEIFWGALAGTLPDALQLAYWKLRIAPLRALQRFHRWMHAVHRLDDRPWFGPLSQAIIVLAIVFLLAK